MPQISRARLSRQVEEELVETFLEGIVIVQDKRLARQVAADLFTPTEKIMLAKRLLIAVLLEEGYDYRAIEKSLKVTPTTINSIRAILVRSGAGFRALAELLKGGRATLKRKQEQERRSEEATNRIAHFLDMLRLPVKGSKRDMIRWRKAMTR
ncbi:hypothetical protein HYZ80_03005 [Candidatus Parcubacteria bacterium]|nr:hypothetical protein [Candidatus Parcubacteria bacterium]